MVPHTTARPIKLRVSHLSIYLFLALWMALIFWAIILKRKDMDYQKAINRNRLLTKHSSYIQYRSSKSKILVNELKELEARLRSILTFKSQKDFVESYSFSEANQQSRNILASLLEHDYYRSEPEWISKESRLLLFLPFKKPSIRNDSILAFSYSPFTEKSKTEYFLDALGLNYIPVRAAADGKVILAGWEGPAYGHMVMIDHGRGFSTRYGHNASLLVKIGDRVKRGQVIAFLHTENGSVEPEFPYEVWRYGKPLQSLQARNGRRNKCFLVAEKTKAKKSVKSKL